MKDEKGGIYYYPFPGNKRVRMYVKESEGNILFRMWSGDDNSLWSEHGWIPHEAVLQASGMYSRKDFNPEKVYDIRIARALIRDEKSSDQ